MTPQELLEQQIVLFEKNMQSVIKKLNRDIAKMVSKLETVNGSLLITENVSNAVLIKKEIAEALKNSGYFDLAKEAVKKNKELMDLQILDISKRMGERFGKVDANTLRSLFKMDYVGMQNLADTAVPAISNVIMQNVMIGGQYSTMVEQLSGQLGKFESYANTYLKTAKSQFIQKTEDYVADDIKFGSDKDDIWQYFGAPLQDNSHKECIWALRKKEHRPYFTDRERRTFEAGGGLPHGEPRWNCQHSFLMTNKTHEDYLKA